MTALSDYTVAEVASLIGVSKPTIYKLIRTNKLVAYKAAKCTRITRESLAELRSNSERSAGGE